MICFKLQGEKSNDQVTGSVFYFSRDVYRVADPVKASSFGFNAGNATECLQKAINSKAPQIIIDHTGSDWIIDPVELVSDQEIIIAKDVTIRALKNGYKDKNDSMFTSRGGKNIIIRGEGNSLLIMNKADYQNKKLYEPAEWRHIFNFLSCENITVRDLTLRDSGGDGIYLGYDWRNNRTPYCENILLENLIVEEQHRQGISVITARNLTVRNCTFNNTAGTMPQSGIDFEPNGASERLENCLIEKCTFNGNKGSGIEIFLNSFNEKTLPTSITIKDCQVGDNTNNVLFMQGKHHGVRGKIEFINCTFTAGKNKSNIRLDNNGSEFEFLFRDCTVNTAGSAPGNGAFNISSTLPATGKIALENVAVNGPCSPVSVKAISGKTPGLENLSGNLTLNSNPYDLAGFIAAYEAQRQLLADLQDAAVDLNLLTVSGAALRPTEKSGFPLRGTGTFLQYCEAGQDFKVELKPHPVGRNRQKQAISVLDPQGKNVRSFELTPDGKPFLLEFTAEQSGIYQIKYDTRRAMLFIKSDMPGHGFLLAGEHGLISPWGKLYFEVPAGVEEFHLVVSGDPGETLTATLLDPAGKEVFSKKDFDEKTIFTGKRKDASKAELWSIRLGAAKEDASLRLCAPLIPVVSDNPTTLLRLK